MRKRELRYSELRYSQTNNNAYCDIPGSNFRGIDLPYTPVDIRKSTTAVRFPGNVWIADDRLQKHSGVRSRVYI